MKVLVSDIVNATGGKLLSGDMNKEINHIAIDSRVMEGNDLFIPIIGEKTDGHLYIDKALANGAAATLTSKTDIALDDEHSYVLVDDTVMALQKIGEYLRSEFKMPFVGITGSSGKTTTREMVACALLAGKKVTATAGNSNSQIGVPITLSKLDKDADVAVMELGVSMPGEMSRLAKMARVDVAIMINIGVAHIEHLGLRENILKEKLHITDGFTKDNTLILNGDDDMLRTLKGEDFCKIISYGFNEDNNVRATCVIESEDGTKFTAYVFDKKVQVNLGVFGRHNVYNALAALAACYTLGVDLDAAARRLATFKGFPRRFESKKMNGFTVIDDSYNANPDSMKAALKALAGLNTSGRKIAVLADMFELGEGSFDMHSDVGRFAKDLNFDKVITIGSYAKNISNEIEGSINACSNEEAFAKIKDIIKKDDVILVKGSNGMHLDKLVKLLEEIKI